MARSTVAVLAAAALLVTACGADGADAPAAPPADEPAAEAPSYEPAVVMGACADPVPVDPRVECGVLTVPADRAEPEGDQVRLPFAIVRTAAAEPEPDPIVYFEGGPGGEGLSDATPFLEGNLGGDRDLIVFDQRGTGRAEPNLDCPEIRDAFYAVFAEADDPAGEVSIIADALNACRDRLEGEGIDFADYNTSATADDADDLRRALEIERWNIWGASYGTLVAQDVMRRHPEAVRSATLDSVVTVDDAPRAEYVAGTATRAFEELAAGCAEDAACAETYGDIGADLDELATSWNAEPQLQEVTDPASGEVHQVAITGADAVAGIWNAMYDTELIGVLPSVIAELIARGPGTAALVDRLAGSGVSQLTDLAEAMGLSVNCSDFGNIGPGAPPEEVIAGDPKLAGLVYLDITTECDLWDVEPVDASFNEPVESDIPTLIVAGEYDPVTPPEGGERTARTLSAGTFLLFPGVAHGVIPPSECAEAIFRAFVVDPTAPPDESCIAELGPPIWAGAGP